MVWNRKFWGVEFSSSGDKLGDKPMLLGIGWHEVRDNPRYAGEPTRPLLFTTRTLARAWCKKQMEKYKDRNDVCKYWRFRPVRVRELISRI